MGPSRAWIVLCVVSSQTVAAPRPESIVEPARVAFQDPAPVPEAKPPTPEAKPPVVESSPIAVPTPPVVDWTSRWEEFVHRAALVELAQAHPAYVRVTSLGQSRAGREIDLLAISDHARGEPDKKAAVLVVNGLAPEADGRPPGPAAAVHAARVLVERAETDPALRALLGEAVILIVPAPDPDAAFDTTGASVRPCRLDRNFPALWKPWSSEACAQGPYPLSEPETRGLARLLAARVTIGAVLVLRRDEGAPAVTDPRADMALADSGLVSRILGSKDLGAIGHATRRLAQAGLEAGSLAAFAQAEMGAFVWVADPWTVETVDGPLGRAPRGFVELPDACVGLTRELPRLLPEVKKVERLRENLWLLDMAVENQGGLATMGTERRKFWPSSAWLAARSGRVVGVGLQRVPTAETSLTVGPNGRFALGHIEGREHFALHLIAEGENGLVLELELTTLRGPSARVSVTLE